MKYNLVEFLKLQQQFKEILYIYHANGSYSLVLKLFIDRLVHYIVNDKIRKSITNNIQFGLRCKSHFTTNQTSMLIVQQQNKRVSLTMLTML